MSNSKFNLVEIVKALFKGFKFILIFTFCAVLIGYIFAKFQKKEYASRSTFIVKSMATMDRSHIFRKLDFQGENYFATEDDIDHVLTLLESNSFYDNLYEKFDLKNKYKVDSDEKAKKKLRKNVKYKRNATKSIELSIVDEDSILAQQLTQEATDHLELMLKDYFSQSQEEMAYIMDQKVQGIDSILRIVQDSILKIRTEYNVFDQLLPTRNPILVTEQKGLTNKAEGMEALQKFTSQKDRLIKDRDEYYSLMNENKVEVLADQIQLFYRVELPKIPSRPEWPNKPFILIVSFLSGLFFSSLIVLLLAGLKKQNQH